MKRLRDLMTLTSRVRYLFWRAVPLKKALPIKLTNGHWLVLRGAPATDLGTAYEVFVAQVYKPPPVLERGAVRRIVDLGANVGCTCVYWAWQYPDAQIEAYEPHPEHLNLIRQTVRLNKLGGRVKVCGAAATSLVGQGYISDKAACSKIVPSDQPGNIPIPTVDFFAEMNGRAIDLLKMDIEGGEYALLADPRFASLRVSALIMEWHNTPDHPDAQAWCAGRLSDLGYKVEIVADRFGETETGYLWAFRDGAAAKDCQ